MWRLLSLAALLWALLLASSASAEQPCPRPALQIYKERGELVLTCGGQLRHTFSVTFGGEPKGPKRQQGDDRTPEGRYVICGKHASARFYKFLSVSYPSVEDAAAALRRRTISRAQHEAVVSAQRTGRCPPPATPLGGAIGIHGFQPRHGWALSLWTGLSRLGRLYRRLGFSAGCIMLRNEDVDVLWALVPVGTPVEIHGMQE